MMNISDGPNEGENEERQCVGHRETIVLACQTVRSCPPKRIFSSSKGRMELAGGKVVVGGEVALVEIAGLSEPHPAKNKKSKPIVQIFS